MNQKESQLQKRLFKIKKVLHKKGKIIKNIFIKNKNIIVR